MYIVHTHHIFTVVELFLYVYRMQLYECVHYNEHSKTKNESHYAGNGNKKSVYLYMRIQNKI
jgi:hypothetical protein